MRVLNSKKSIALLIVCAIITFVLFGWNYYPQSGLVASMYSDTADHAIWSQAMVSGGVYPVKANGYPLFFLVTGFFGKVFNNIHYGITFTAGLIGLFTYFSQIYFFSRTKIKSAYLIIALSFCLTFIWPIVFDFSRLADCDYLKEVYLKSWSATPAHNLTSLAVRPVSLIAISMFLDFFKTELSIKKVSIFSLMLLISVLIKPSFYQYFSISAAVYTICYFLIERDINSFKKSLFIALSLVPATIWVIYSMRFSINGMQFYPFRSLVLNYDNDIYYCFKSLFKGIVFCVAVFFYIFIKRAITKEMWFIYLCIFVAFLEFVLLIESGEEHSFNFSWGYMNAMYIMFVYSTKELFSIKFNNKIETIYKYICSTILLLHIISGISAYINYANYYRFRLMITENNSIFKTDFKQTL